jgi:HK97 family phage portal protein
MSILGRIQRNIRNDLAVTDEKAWDSSLWRLAGSQSLSGENVTEHSALTYSAVWCAINLISGTVSGLPLHLLRQDRRKTIKVTEKPLFSVLHSQANPYMTAQVYREVMTAHVLSWGNCYSEKVYDGFGQVIALWPIPPHRVRMEMRDGELVYLINVDGEEIPLTRAKILHVPGLGYDGFRGYPVTAMARKSIGLGMAMETFGSLYFGNGTHPGVVVSHPGKLGPQAHENLKNSLTAAHSGLGQSHRLLLLEEAMKIEKIGIAPEESQFLESRQFQIPEIARWFNLPPHKLKDLTKSSFSNIESEQISFVTDSILPWLIRFEQNFDMQLLSESEKRQQKLYFRHNVDGLLRGNAKDRAEYYRTMFNFGGMSINDIREKENMDPVENEFADEYFVPLNMVPLSMLKEQLAAQKSQKTPNTGDPNKNPAVDGGQP